MATVAPIAGRYELRTLLLDDGVKQTWAAYDQQLDRDVSVELVTGADAELQGRFLARARLLAGENHPHLATVYDTGHQDDQVYAVLEPETDGTLAQRLQHGPPFNLTQVVELGIALTVATAAALQRDLDVEPLDPADILLRDGDHVKLGNLLLRPTATPATIAPSEQPLVTQIAALLVAAIQPPGTVMKPVTRATDLPASLPATLRTIVLAAIAPRGASIRTLGELRQALTDYRGAAISTTRAFAPLSPGNAADAAGAALLGGAGLPVTRAMPRGGPPLAVGRKHRRASPWLSIIGLVVVLLLIGGGVAFAEWLGSVDTVAPTVPAISGATQATATPRAIGFPPIFSRPSPTPPGAPRATDTPLPAATPVLATQGQLGGNAETPTATAMPTVSGAHATDTALAMASATAGYYATQTATVAPSPSPEATPSPTVSPTPTATPAPTDTPAPPTATAIPTGAVPSVVGRSVADATQILSQAGFNTDRTPNRASTGVRAGDVMAQDPPPTSVVPLGSTIHLTVSSGPPASVVPNVVGMTVQQARDAITGVGLKSRVTSVPSRTVPEGSVISQNPGPGTAMQPGAQVDLTVSAGNKIAVPSVVGMPEGQAQDTIRAAGLATTFVNHSGHSSAVQVGQVESQEPVSGTLVAPGTVVNINVRTS
jgi:eukaryotic-like serine/threonine-protein kinase